MTSTVDLSYLIKKEIEENGPMPISKFMSHALNYNKKSYYKNSNHIGKIGDFITSPEISQLFGETIGVWCANYWIIENCPKKIKLIELGPGKGTLMADILRATKNVKGFHEAIEICLVEINPSLRSEQKTNINHPNLHWFKTYEEIPQDCFSIIIANEFFDALPIEQYIKRNDIWYINTIDINDEFGNLCITKNLIKTEIKQFLTEKYSHVPEGGIIEINDESSLIIKQIVENLKKHEGIMLIIDYGYMDSPIRNFISTLQSVKDHKFNPIFNDIGDADITAHINFSSLIETAEIYGSKTYGPISQNNFLRNMQIEVRKEILLNYANNEQREEIISGYTRIIDEDQMGELFKVIAISNKTVIDYIGF